MWLKEKSNGAKLDNPGAVIMTVLLFGTIAIIAIGTGLVKFTKLEATTALLYALPFAVIIGVISSYIRICRRIAVEATFSWWL